MASDYPSKSEVWGTFETLGARLDDLDGHVVTALAGSASAASYRHVTDAYIADATDGTIDCSGTFSVTLPTAIGSAGKTYNVKNSGSGVITVEASGGQAIDGELSKLLDQFDCITVQSTGSNWIII